MLDHQHRRWRPIPWAMGAWGGGPRCRPWYAEATVLQPARSARVTPTDQRGRRPRRDFGPPPSAMRPWAPGFGVRAVDRPWVNRPRTGTDRSTDGHGPVHGRGRTGPRTGADRSTDGGGKTTDGAGRSGHADRSRPDSRSDLPFQDACSMSPSPSSPRSCSVSWVPRASAMRWLAAVAWPSMQWA
jgi:hypothetical protein